VNVPATAKKLPRVIAEAVDRFVVDQCPQLAAGIAYRVLFSITPLAIVLVSIFGLALQKPVRRCTRRAPRSSPVPPRLYRCRNANVAGGHRRTGRQRLLGP